MIQQKPRSISAKDLESWLKSPSIKPLLVDVREDEERALASFTEASLHLPLTRSSSWMDSLPELLGSHEKLVIFCHAGIRSWNFGLWLIEQAWEKEVWNLDGGIDAWSKDVDPTIPRY